MELGSGQRQALVHRLTAGCGKHVAHPLPWCHLDGRLLATASASISPFDRSFLFGDGIYEVLPVYAGRLFRPALHFDRLARSATALRISNPHDHRGWQALLEALL